MSDRKKRRKGDAQAEVTLRGARMTDHPENAASLRGELVEWERMTRGRVLEMFDRRGCVLETPRRRVGWGEAEYRVARRAWRRRWRRMIEDGAFDVTERFEKTRRDAQRTLAISLIPVGVAVAMGLMLVAGVWTETLPGFEWIKWVVGVAIGVMVTGYCVAMLGPSLAIVRTDVVRARATPEWVEVERRGGDVRRWRWSQLRAVRHHGFKTCASLRFDDGGGFSMHLGRLRPVIEWQTARLFGETLRVGWGGPMLSVLIMQVVGVVMAWVVMRIPGILGPRTAWEMYAVISALGALFVGVGWWVRWVEVRESRKWRPRRVTGVPGDTTSG